MQKKYTDGARAFIWSIFAAFVLAIGAFAVLIYGLVDPSPHRPKFTSVELVTDNENYIRCEYTRPIATLTDDEMELRLRTMTSYPVCITKNRMGYWLIYRGEMP